MNCHRFDSFDSIGLVYNTTTTTKNHFWVNEIFSNFFSLSHWLKIFIWIYKIVVILKENKKKKRKKINHHLFIDSIQIAMAGTLPIVFRNLNFANDYHRMNESSFDDDHTPSPHWKRKKIMEGGRNKFGFVRQWMDIRQVYAEKRVTLLFNFIIQYRQTRQVKN